jgi:glutaryl-CoA dehydrogenase
MIRNFLRFNKTLTEQQNLVISSVNAFANDYLKSRINSDYKNEVVDRSIFKEMGNLGIFGPTIKGYGCISETNLTYGLIAKEIESIDSGYRSMFSVQSSLVMLPIYKFGSDYLKDKYLPKLASGDFIGCFGLTESNHGSNPAGMETKAVEDGENYILNGSKMWISNSPIADVFIVWGKCNGVLKGFVLERDFEGISTPLIEDKLSLKASPTGMIHLSDVKVPKKNVLNVEGFKGPFTCLNSARFGISFGVLGVMEVCLEEVIDYVQNRNQFGNLATKQLIQSKLAEIFIKYNSSLSLCYQVANCLDSPDGDYIPEMISMAKRNSCENALEAARLCRDMYGGNGITLEYNVFRHMTNLETVKTYEGTHDIHGLILGKYLTGEVAF